MLNPSSCISKNFSSVKCKKMKSLTESMSQFKLQKMRIYIKTIVIVWSILVNYNATAGVVNNVTDEFSIANGNPNGVWTYGWMSVDYSVFTTYQITYSFHPSTLLPTMAWCAFDEVGPPVIWKNINSTIEWGVAPGQISLHPGPQFQPSVLRFTAPVYGTYTINGQFFSGHNGIMQVGIRKDENWIWQGVDAGVFGFSTVLMENEHIDFIVYGGYGAGNTPLEVTIERFTMPAAEETFNHSGSLPPNWTLQSSSPALTTPWTPVQENGSDWAVQTSHPALGAALNEWLISPVYDLSWWEDVRAGFTQQVTHANSEAAFRTSTNGGLSWTTRGSFTQNTTGDTLFDVSSWADGNANARFAFRFHADAATGGSAWRVDDFWLDGTPKPPVASAPEPDQNLPVWDQISGTVGCLFSQPLGVRGDSLQVRVDLNGDGDYLDGATEAWQLLPAQADGASLTLGHAFSVAQNGWYLFEFRAKSGAGRWGYSGNQGQEGPEDDWGVEVAAEPPVASAPMPAQPPVAWNTLTGTIGCTFSHSVSVDGSSLAWRLDLNRDGDYLDGGMEDWQSVAPQASAPTVVAMATVTVPENGSYAFEWKARALGGLWAWSGTDMAEGLTDDWQVLVQADVDPPVFSSLLPEGQPTPAWQATLNQTAGATVSDALSGVNGAALSWRVDINQDGDYLDGGMEEWQPLPAQASGPSLVLTLPVALPVDGDFSLLVRAADLVGNEAILTLHVRGDVTPPTLSTLLFSGANATSVALLFTPATDLALSHYEVRVSTDATVDQNDPLWGPQQDPGLSQITASGTTVAGLSPGTAYWFRLYAVDKAGNRNAGSNVLTHVTGDTPVVAVTDLRATRTTEGVLLSWTAPTTDVDGYSPVAIERYDIHASDTPWFVPSSDTHIGSSTSPGFLIGFARTQLLQVYYRVVVVGAGIGAPLGGMVQVPAGSFTMGPDALGNGAAHAVTLTHPFWMDAFEVTNADYLTALQWALDNDLVTASAATVTAHGVELVDLDDPDCELAFDPATQQFSIVARSHSTSWGGPGPAYPSGYDPSRHPAKEVSWYGAACYCDWRSLREGLTPFYNGNWATDATHDPYATQSYRLPTEAEWEYTARYNDARLYPWGGTAPEGCSWANLNCVGWTKPVGLYPLGENALGIKDLIGNVLEFTNDRWDPAYTAESVNPIGPASGTSRVCRGSDMGDAPLVYAQSTTRQQYGIIQSNPWMGFRAVRCEEARQPTHEVINILSGNGAPDQQDEIITFLSSGTSGIFEHELRSVDFLNATNGDHAIIRSTIHAAWLPMLTLNPSARWISTTVYPFDYAPSALFAIPFVIDNDQIVNACITIQFAVDENLGALYMNEVYLDESHGGSYGSEYIYQNCNIANYLNTGINYLYIKVDNLQWFTWGNPMGILFNANIEINRD